MSDIPIAPQVLQHLLLARRACRILGDAGDPADLWETYSLAQTDAEGLSRALDRGPAPASQALQQGLLGVRRDTGPLVEYLRQALPATLPLLDNPKALDLALVFIMSTPPARTAVVKWFKNPSGSREEAMKLLKTMGRMVESYQKAIAEEDEKAAPPAAPPPPVVDSGDELDRLLQAKLDTARRSREKGQTERRQREKTDDEAKASIDAGLVRGAETQRREKEKSELERIAREKADADRKAKEQAEAERRAWQKAQIEKVARDKADPEVQARAAAEAERARQEAEAAKAAIEKDRKDAEEKAARAKEDADRVARQIAEAEKTMESVRLAREKAEAERKHDAEVAARRQEEAEKAAREEAQAEKLRQQIAEAQKAAEALRIERERLEAEAAAKLKEEDERQERDLAAAREAARKREQAEREAREKAEREEAEARARIKAEAEENARRQAEAERLAKEKAEAERQAKLKAEAERIARMKEEADKAAREKAEAERIAKEKAEAERIAREKAEAERIAREKAEAERIAREKAEAERIAREKAEAERVAKEKAEAERIAREKEEAERKAREKAEKERKAREAADAQLTPEQRTARDEARVKFRESMPGLLADPWRDLKVGAWFRVKSVSGRDETYTDSGLRERGKGYSMLGVQKCVGGRSEWENMDRVQNFSVQHVGNEMVEVGGTLLDCEAYQITSKAGVEKVWLLLDGPLAGAPVKSESPSGAFLAKKLEKETLTVGSKTFDCAKLEGEETAGGKTTAVTRWWSSAFPLGPVKTAGGATTVEAVKAGDNWGNRPPFPT
jgi:hypothetical protein